MTIQDKRDRITVLIDNIKEHSDRLKENQTLPILELSVILSKITQLHEETLILKYLCAVNQNHLKDEFEIHNSTKEEQLSISTAVEDEDTSLEEETLLDENNKTLQQRDSIDTIIEATLAEEQTVIKEEISKEPIEPVVDDASLPVFAKEIVEEQTEVIREEEPSKEVEEFNSLREENASLEEIPVVNNEELEKNIPEPELVAEENSTEIVESTEEDKAIQEAAAAEEESPLLNENTTFDEEVSNSGELKVTLKDIEKGIELDSKPDLNEAFSEEEDASLSGQLKKQPISDLLTAIGLNERYLYANDLFDGDMDAFKSSMLKLNEMGSGELAKEYFNNELKVNFNWEDDNELANALFQLVERRYQS